VPVIMDVDCGHVPPQLALLNGAVTELTIVGHTQTVTQHLR